MTSALWLTSAAIVALLAMSFFFSGSETAITAASRARMHQMARSGSGRAKLVERLSAEKERVIGAILLGNNIVNILASTLAASVLIQIFGEAGIAYATVVMTMAVVIFSEVLPKTLAIQRPDAFALVIAPILNPIVTIFAPVTLTIQKLVRAILQVFGVRVDSSRDISGAEEIRDTLDLLHSEGEVVKNDKDRLGGLLDLKDLQVADIMVHRTRMLALDASDPPEALVDAVLASAFTRIPLYRDNPDNIVGVVHAKDVLRAVLAPGADVKTLDLLSIATKPWFIPETTSAETQLNAFLKRKSHFALVVDEYGDVQGLITLEDILEEIVGAISDEHDVEVAGVTRQADGSYLIDGGLPIRDLNRVLDWDLPDEDFTTVAGLVIHVARMIPEPGQVYDFGGFRFTVLRKLRNRITQVRAQAVEGETDAAI
ncbi:MAG: HlyC/CorC family transporter [Devosia sp.]